MKNNETIAASEPSQPIQQGSAPSRREMLRGMSVFAAAAAPTAAVAAPAEPSPPSDPNTVEFNETDHIRQYYALARR